MSKSQSWYKEKKNEKKLIAVVVSDIGYSDIFRNDISWRVSIRRYILKIETKHIIFKARNPFISDQDYRPVSVTLKKGGGGEQKQLGQHF